MNNKSPQINEYISFKKINMIFALSYIDILNNIQNNKYHCGFCKLLGKQTNGIYRDLRVKLYIHMGTYIMKVISQIMRKQRIVSG